MTDEARLFHCYRDGNFYELRQGGRDATNILTLYINHEASGNITFNEIRKFIEYKNRSSKNDNG